MQIHISNIWIPEYENTGASKSFRLACVWPHVSTSMSKSIALQYLSKIHKARPVLVLLPFHHFASTRTRAFLEKVYKILPCPTLPGHNIIEIFDGGSKAKQRTFAFTRQKTQIDVCIRCDFFLSFYANAKEERRRKNFCTDRTSKGFNASQNLWLWPECEFRSDRSPASLFMLLYLSFP